MGFDMGKLVYPGAQELSLPPCDLFVKPARGKGGAGAERWGFVAGTWRDGSASRTAEDLTEHCRRLSLHGPILVQEALLNHQDFAAFNMGALATLRIMTILDESGRPEVHFAVLRMPSRPGAVVDNFRAGGIAAAVDLATGMVGEATDIGLARRTGWHRIHPSSGAQIAGIVVPSFPEVIALAIRAHQVFATTPVAGWDIAVCDEGVVIVEANGYPDLDLIQRTHRRPVGGTRFCRLLAWHVARVSASGEQQEP